MMKLNELEIKLVRLAFDLASPEGEHRNATDKLIASLRNRGISAETFLTNGSGFGNYEALYRQAQLRVSGLQTENNSLMKDKRTLEARITELLARPSTRPASSTSGAPGFTTHSRLQTPVSSILNFQRTPDGAEWQATDRDGTVWSICRQKGRIHLGRKRSWESRFRTLEKHDTVDQALASCEAQCAR